MTVRELREALDNLPDDQQDLQAVVYAGNDWGWNPVAGVSTSPSGTRNPTRTAPCVLLQSDLDF